MRVIATAEGYDGRATRKVGEEFDMPPGAKGSWFVPKEAPPAETVKPAKARPPKVADPVAEGADLA